MRIVCRQFSSLPFLPYILYLIGKSTEMKHFFILGALALLFFSCNSKPDYDTILRNGTVYDGSGNPPYQADVGIKADTIAFIGDLSEASAETNLDVEGLAVAPGFINMLSWAIRTLIEDGKSQSDIRQGITLEVFGEGTSMGPLNEDMAARMKASQGDIKFDVEWRTLGEYLQFMENKGVSPNVASFLGAATLRIHQIGYENRPPTEEELENMRNLVHEGMKEGALGIGSSLIYAPAFYADTEELIALCQVASQYGGSYISHLRSEGNAFLESVDELMRIAHEADIPAEIYHLKASGAENWHKLDLVIAKIDSAQKAGLKITTDMYTYTAGSTGLDAAMPPWVQEGGYEAWAERLKDPAIRKRVLKEMKTPTKEWENLLLATGSAEKALCVGFKNDSLRYLTGKSLAEIAQLRGKSPEETAMDLVIEDGSRVQMVYFLMSEENVQKQIQLPYMSFGSDAGSMAPEGVFLNTSTHPRAYGNFARLLGKYVREEQLIPLEEAIYKLTTLPATNLKLKKRGALMPGYFADLAIFDPEKISDHATYDEPQQFATGMVHVFVNGEAVLYEGEHTGATPGRFVKGPGYRNDE